MELAIGHDDTITTSYCSGTNINKHIYNTIPDILLTQTVFLANTVFSSYPKAPNLSSAYGT